MENFVQKSTFHNGKTKEIRRSRRFVENLKNRVTAGDSYRNLAFKSELEFSFDFGTFRPFHVEIYKEA